MMDNHKISSPLISTSELHQKLTDDPNHFIIIDARFDLTRPDYGASAYQIGRIPTALRVELEQDICSVVTNKTGRHPLKPLPELARFFQTLGLNQDSHVVIYDDKNSMFAIHIWWILNMLGHEYIQVLDGGISAWQNDGYEIETGTPLVMTTLGNFQIMPNPFNIVSADDIMLFLKDGTGDLCIVDARGGARYRGEVEPLDPVAGHIPTAINRPFELNLVENGQFKEPHLLKKEWETFLQDHNGKNIVHQCGSGISGCHNLFALYYAGLGITLLYPGSWSEWCKEASRPVATTEKTQ